MGGGIGMGNTCKPMAVSFQCMTKSTTNKKKCLENVILWLKCYIMVKFLNFNFFSGIKSIRIFRGISFNLFIQLINLALKYKQQVIVPQDVQSPFPGY